MKKNNEQSAILHDAYFNKPPCLIRLFLVRLVLLCGISASAAAAVADLYHFEEARLYICGFSAAAAAIVYIAASLLPTGIVYFSGLAGFVAAFFNDSVREKLSFFFDYLMLRLNSRLLKTDGFTIHDTYLLKNGFYSAEMLEGCEIGFIMFGMLMALLFTAASRTRFRPFYAMLIFIAFAAPSFAAEIAGYNHSLAFFAAFYFAFYAVRMAYELDGVFVFEKTRVAGDAARRNEKSYRKRMFFSVFGRKLRNDIPRYLKYSANSIIALLVTGAIMITTANLIPDGTTFDYEDILSEIKDLCYTAAEKFEEKFDFNFDIGSSRARDEYFSYSQYGDNSGGIGISKPSDSDRPVLDVTLERNDISVYLRGDIGVDFTGTEWTPIRDEYEEITDSDGIKFSEKLKDFYPEIQYRVTRQVMLSEYNPDDFLPLQKVSLTYRQKTNVVFQPMSAYNLDYKESEHLESYGDTILRASGSSGLSKFESLALTPDMSFSELDSLQSRYQFFRGNDKEWSIPGGITNAKYNLYMDTYKRYVDTAYGSTSADVSMLIDTLYSGGYISSNMTPVQITNGVCRYFKENFSYSLTVDNGSDAEVMDNFLYETKQGHCALFATASVLALRSLDIPSRYVTGYVVSGDGNYTSDGYLYTLREKDLHAWIEVYFDGIGWLPFDPTAAVDGFAAAEPEHTRQTMTFTSISSMDVNEHFAETELTTIPSSDEQEEELIETGGTTLTSPVITGSDGEEIITGTEAEPPVTPEKKNELIPVIIAVLAVIAAVGAVITAAYLLVRRVDEAEKRVMNGFRKKSPNRAVAEMYKLVMIILNKSDLTPGCEMMVDFAARVDASIFLKGSNVFMVDVTPVFVKCEFGNAEVSPVTEEERAAVYKFTVAVYRRYMDRKGSLGRFITKISLFL